MPKTITLRLSDEEYIELSKLAKTERRSISNLIIHYTYMTVSNLFQTNATETKEILEDAQLMNNLNQAQKDIKSGKYTIVA